MDTKIFQDLVEIQSLDNIILTHQKVIDENNKRIKFIETKRTQVQLELNEIIIKKESTEKEYAISEKELDHLNERLQHANKALDDATDERQANALNSEINDLTPKIEVEEKRSFEFLENMESFEQKIIDHTEYLKGSLESLNDIKGEVTQGNKKEANEIENCEKRITSLKEELTGSAKEILESIFKKYRFKNPISIVDTNNCPHCRLSIPANLFQNLEKSISLELCPGCERILIPKSALKV